MKKFLTLMLVVLLVSVAFVGCSSPAEEEPAEDPAPVEEPAGEEEPAEGEAGEAGSIAKIGLGHVISTAKSKGAEGDNTAQAQADVTVAAVGFDSEGKVVDVTIDVAQTKIAFDEDMAVTNKDADILTKKELKDDYNMRGASGIDKEWFEQAEAFEEWMIGKTAEEIVNIPVTEKDESHTHVPDVEELTSSVTIDVEGYITAVEEAWKNAEDVEGAEKVALAIETSIAKSADAEEGKPASAQADTNIAAVAFDADENVAGVILDVAQVKIPFDEEGQVATETTEGKTKKELKDDYNMRGASEIDKEWFEQAEALEEWMVGKSVDEILDMPVKERDENHKHVPDVEELTSTVTITVEGYLSVVEKALNNPQ